VFFISLMHHHHPALHHQALIFDLYISRGVSTLVVKPSFPQRFFPYSYLSLPVVHVLEFDHSAFGSHWRW